MNDQVPIAAYALAVEVDRRNGMPLGSCQPMPLTAFVADLRALVRREAGQHDLARSDTPRATR